MVWPIEGDNEISLAFNYGQIQYPQHEWTYHYTTESIFVLATVNTQWHLEIQLVR